MRRTLTILPALALAAVAATKGEVIERDPEAEAARRKTPPPRPPSDGVTSLVPQRTLSDLPVGDQDRIRAAIKKRERKASKRLALRS